MHDAVIVGARCAGSTLALALAQRGWDVLIVERDTLPSETVSTHFLYPNTLARLERLGILDTLRALEHYEWSFAWGRFPRPESELLFRTWASDPAAGQALRDSFRRLVRPSEVLAAARLTTP